MTHLIIESLQQCSYGWTKPYFTESLTTLTCSLSLRQCQNQTFTELLTWLIYYLYCYTVARHSILCMSCRDCLCRQFSLIVWSFQIQQCPKSVLLNLSAISSQMMVSILQTTLLFKSVLFLWVGIFHFSLLRWWTVWFDWEIIIPIW